jgi:hypothetical protein
MAAKTHSLLLLFSYLVRFGACNSYLVRDLCEVSRVRRGLELYRRGNNVPDALSVGLVRVLANTSDGRDFRALYNPMSDGQTLKALLVLERSGEVKIEGDSVRVVRLSDDQPKVRKVQG